MYYQDYLALRLVRVTSSEQWSPSKNGLSFIFPKAGSGKYFSRENTQILSPGIVFVGQGNAGGSICVAKGSELVFWVFCVQLEHLFPLFASEEISLLQSITDDFKNSKLFPDSSELSKVCHRLIEEVPPDFNLNHRSRLLQVASAILTEEFKTARLDRIGSANVEERMIQVFEKLTAEQLVGFSVGELAERFGCSRRHLNRLFHQFFGFSVAALRMEMRLLKVVSLLRNTNEKIINVAEQCGFNHLGLFNTCFKRRFGCSPGEWRKQSAEHEKAPKSPKPNDSTCPLHSKGLCPMGGGPEAHFPVSPKSVPARKASTAGISRGIFPVSPTGPPNLLAIGNDKAPSCMMRPA